MPKTISMVTGAAALKRCNKNTMVKLSRKPTLCKCTLAQAAVRDHQGVYIIPIFRYTLSSSSPSGTLLDSLWQKPSRSVEAWSPLYQSPLSLIKCDPWISNRSISAVELSKLHHGLSFSEESLCRALVCATMLAPNEPRERRKNKTFAAGLKS